MTAAQEKYSETLATLSERIVVAQGPIRVLDSIKWDNSVHEFLTKTKHKNLPKIDADYYRDKNPLEFDPLKKRTEFETIAKDIESALPPTDPLRDLLSRIAREYIDVVRMLEGRGTKKFWEASKKLYGSPKDTFYDETCTILDLGRLLYETLNQVNVRGLSADHEKVFDTQATIQILNARFETYFHAHQILATPSDGIVADAAAGAQVVKIRIGASFSEREIDILEVHEGWVHIGTSQNGSRQRIAKWLAKGPPRVTSTQEGLAVMMEIFTFRTNPTRARRINDRILAIHMAEEGANLLEVLEYYRTEGYSEEECLTHATRVFRGGVIEGGAPFTKDIAYCKGFIENYNFIRSAIAAGKPYLIPFLFAGKLHVDDVPIIYRKHEEGIVDAPLYLPPQFRDLNGLAVWMSFSNFLNKINLKKIRAHYERVFSIL